MTSPFALIDETNKLRIISSDLRFALILLRVMKASPWFFRYHLCQCLLTKNTTSLFLSFVNELYALTTFSVGLLTSKLNSQLPFFEPSVFQSLGGLLVNFQVWLVTRLFGSPLSFVQTIFAISPAGPPWFLHSNEIRFSPRCKSEVMFIFFGCSQELLSPTSLPFM